MTQSDGVRLGSQSLWFWGQPELHGEALSQQNETEKKSHDINKHVKSCLCAELHTLFPWHYPLSYAPSHHFHGVHIALGFL